MADRRQQSSRLPLIAVGISAIGLILGPCSSVVISAVGVYASSQTKSAVTDSALASLTDEVKKVGAQLEKLNEKMANTDQARSGFEAKVNADLGDHNRRLDELKSVTERLEEHDKKQESTLAGLTVIKK